MATPSSMSTPPTRCWICWISEAVGARRSLALPIRPVAEPDEVPLDEFDAPEGAEPLRSVELQPSKQRWRVIRDLVSDESELEVRKGIGVVRFPDIDLDVTHDIHESYRWVADDFESVTGESTWTVGFRRGAWDVRTVTRTTLECTETEFVVHAQIDGYEGDHRIVSRNWSAHLPRDLM